MLFYKFYLKTKHRIYGSHYLRDQGGKCTKLHGHQYEVILTVGSDGLDAKNMVIDTHEINKKFDEYVGTDHLNMNDFLNSENPTMELMAEQFYKDLHKTIPNLLCVAVEETPEASCIYFGDDDDFTYQ